MTDRIRSDITHARNQNRPTQHNKKKQVTNIRYAIKKDLDDQNMRVQSGKKNINEAALIPFA